MITRSGCYCCLLQLFAFVLLASTAPQQQDDVLNDRIRQIFSGNGVQPLKQPVTATQTPPISRVGFDVVVTPVPVDAAQPQQQFNSISGRTPCNCVPYHQCNPSTNNVANDDAANEDDFDGFGLIDIRFNSNDPVCEHFLDICCDNNRTRETSLTPRPQANRPERAMGCGIRNVGGIDFNITGAFANEAGFGEFPWTVAMLHASNFSYFCAGSLIHPRVVLTAVHCIADRRPGDFVVRAGEWDSQTTRERLPYEERSVQRILLHPQYNARNVANDFALVILASAVTLGDHINVVCLPEPNAVPLANTGCFSTGWGKDVFGAAGQFSVIMKRVPLPIVDFNVCQQQLRATRLGPKFRLDRSFICAGGVRNVDTCQGDGGAPLVCPIGIASQNRYEQSGIVAWGIGCNDNIPAAYANVAQARDWIDQQMLSNGFGIDSYSAN